MNAHTTVRSHSTHTQTLNRRAPLGIFTLLFTALAALSLSGCVGLTGASTPKGNSGTNSPADSTGALQASATTLDFGNVTDGSSSPQTLTLSNMGTSSITISQGTVAGTGFSVMGGMNSVSIAGGQNHQFQVQFAPKSAGSVSGSLTITSDATNASMNITLNGTGVAGLAITAQPENQTVTAGQTATFSVTASGSGTLSYQWKKGGANITGAMSASYTTPATTTSESGTQFSVTVTDSTSSSVTSNPASLTVTAAAVAPSITTQPASKTVSAGQAATFSVSATGTAPLTYQWKKNGANVGTNASSYTTPATSASDNNAKFTVTVTNSVSSATSNAATLTVNVPPAITTQPANQNVNVGQTAKFSVVAAGSGTLSYQWKKNGANVGTNASSYTTPATTSSDNNAQFTVTVTDSVSSVTSNAATLSVNTPSTAPSISAQPANQTVIAGQTATFTVSATGTAPLTYQWNLGGSPISGATSPSYTTPATTTANSGSKFTVTVLNSAGKATSNAATLTVNAATLALTASQTTLNFSSVNIGSNSVLPVSFSNGGNSNVTISNVTVSGAGYTANGIGSGQIVAPGKSATLNVTFAPASTGALPGSVTVTSNAANSPASVTLSGTGAQQQVSHSVTLTWTASTSTVTGYNVYRSQVSGGPYTKLDSSAVAATSYADSTVSAGQTYFYVVTSVNSSGVESADSSEVSATVP